MSEGWEGKEKLVDALPEASKIPLYVIRELDRIEAPGKCNPHRISKNINSKVEGGRSRVESLLDEMEQKGLVVDKQEGKNDTHRYTLTDRGEELARAIRPLMDSRRERIKSALERNLRMEIKGANNSKEVFEKVSKWLDRDYGNVPIRVARTVDMDHESQEFRDLLFSVDSDVVRKVQEERLDELEERYEEERKEWEEVKDRANQVEFFDAEEGIAAFVMIECAECGDKIRNRDLEGHFERKHEGREPDWNPLDDPVDRIIKYHISSYLDSRRAKGRDNTRKQFRERVRAELGQYLDDWDLDELKDKVDALWNDVWETELQAAEDERFQGQLAEEIELDKINTPDG